jgi:hypothetical protein
MDVHHRDTEDTEVAQRKTISDSEFEISNLPSVISSLCAPSALSVSVVVNLSSPSLN